jgi:hypothetical protein
VSQRRSVLLLCDDKRRQAANVREHIAALRRLSQHEVHAFNPVDQPRASAVLEPNEFDAVVIHYTIFTLGERYLPRALAEKIASFRGLTIQFLQDEYRQVDAITERSRGMGVDVLFTCVPAPQREELYRDRLPGVELVTTLPGFAPEAALLPDRPIAPRPLDVGYRGREVPYWLGRLGQEKSEIGRRFLEAVAGSDLRCDISSREEDRIYGTRWKRFLLSCKVALGTESGASIADFDGTVEQRTREYLLRHPEARFEEVERAVLDEFEGNLTIAVAPPRLFEAAAAGTALVLFPGGYSGAVEAWRHFVPLEKDLSNVDQVIESIREPKLLEELARNAHADLVLSGRYSLSAFVRGFDELVAERCSASSGTGRPAFRRASRWSRLPRLPRSSRVRGALGRPLVPAVALALVIRDPATRRLLPAARTHPGLGEDLWRLAVLRRLVMSGQVQVARVLEDESRRLLIVSDGDLDDGEPPSLDGVQELVWDNSARGPTVPLLPRGLLSVPLGTRGIPGAYGFDALLDLAQTRRDAVLDVLAPLLR